jgi:hypothetical protein
LQGGAPGAEHLVNPHVVKGANRAIASEIPNPEQVQVEHLLPQELKEKKNLIHELSEIKFE